MAEIELWMIECRDKRIKELEARVAELDGIVEAYKAEVATCHRNELDRIHCREALEKIAFKTRDYAPTLESCQSIAIEALNV